MKVRALAVVSNPPEIGILDIITFVQRNIIISNRIGQDN